MGHHQLDELDEKILKMVVDNARIPFLEVARECGVSGAAIHQRMQKFVAGEEAIAGRAAGHSAGEGRT